MIFKKLLNKIGIDKAILFTSASSMVGTLGSVFTVILIIHFFNEVEQGFYYTFGSIVAIQIFFELGLNGIITQYVAHEVSNLKWVGDNILYGESKYMSRLSSLLHFSVKWYLFFASALVVSLIIVGFIFFNTYDSTGGMVSWVMPWLLLSIGTGINLIVSPIIAFVQGLGKIKEIAKTQLIVLIFRYSIVWGGFVFGAKLFVLGISVISSVLLLIVIITILYRKLLANIWNTVIIEKVHYRSEIFPYQWKIALSWISGYFIFQLFNPVLFATEGAVVAGQMGMTLAALNGILSLSLAWISTKVPLFSGLIAQKKFSQLDNIFNKTLKQSVLINFAALVLMVVVIFLIRFFEIEMSGKLLGNRFLSYLPMLFMMVPIFLNQFTASWATYLRCHKQEPFLINSMLGGVLCVLSTVLFGKYYGVIGITSGYCILSLIMFPWGYYIFRAKKMEWHSTTETVANSI